MNNFVIFGASGDLAKVKLFPALWEIYQKGYKCNYFGYGRTNLSNQDLRTIVKDSVGKAANDFISRFEYVSGNYDPFGLENLKTVLPKGRTIYYLSLPTRFEIIKNLITGLILNGLFDRDFQIVIEKPFGTDFSSAKKLMQFLKDEVGEEHLLLVDHYLAKDLVRDLVSLRFANPIFENLWNNNFVQKIEIVTSETVGIGDRGDYYDNSGAIRDMIQNHMLQMLSLVTMDKPRSLKASEIRKKKKLVLEALGMFNSRFIDNISIGQYRNYRKEKNVSSDSATETYAEIKVEVNNERWKGVPIFLKTGKKLAEKKTQVIIYFKGFESCLWEGNCPVITQNKLEINIYPENDIRLFVNSDVLSPKNLPKQIPLRFGFEDDQPLPLPYANTLVDIYNDDKSYTASIDEILLSWKFVDRVEKWLDGKRTKLLRIY